MDFQKAFDSGWYIGFAVPNSRGTTTEPESHAHVLADLGPDHLPTKNPDVRERNSPLVHTHTIEHTKKY